MMDIETQKDYDIKLHTTFKIGGPAKNVYFPKTVQELVFLLKKNPNSIVLGSCSNIIVSSDGVEEDVIITSKLSDFLFSGNSIKVSCGTRAPLLSKECLAQNLSGFEFMIGFPGSMGGMVNMNASAHSQAVSDKFVSAKVFDRNSKQILNLSKNDMMFDYRTSILAKKPYVLLEAVFDLQPKEKAEIEELMQRNLEFRKLHQPSLKLPNVGSIFKNPENDSAGRLLDLSGAKELSFGGAKVWENHANFIVNVSNATSHDIINLMYKMYSLVKEKYTIELKSEVKFIGKTDIEEDKLWQKLTGKNIQTIQK
ncbi:MAG: UDP-N-acetylmuramate dehydrogenase [Candidatus Gastranaerophilales bacterium]|nr:UDP-N-acetylmuramate dehydrogenase [Candidatus Gastranaerophilales bacterium]